MSDEDKEDLYLIWRQSGTEPQVAWEVWPDWQFDVIADGLREEMAMREAAAEQHGVSAGLPTRPKHVRQADWADVDEQLGGLDE